jgi:rare lipoprotein A
VSPAVRRTLIGLVLVVGCATGPRVADEPAYAPASRDREEGLASWYGKEFHGRITASGVPFDRMAMVAAHPTLPFGTRVRVHRVSTGRTVTVRIVDRGPAGKPRRAGVVIDLSEGAAQKLGIIRAGRARVQLEVLERPSTEE